VANANSSEVEGADTHGSVAAAIPRGACVRKAPRSSAAAQKRRASHVGCAVIANRGRKAGRSIACYASEISRHRIWISEPPFREPVHARGRC